MNRYEKWFHFFYTGGLSAKSAQQMAHFKVQMESARRLRTLIEG